MHGDRGMFISPVQLTTSRIGNLTRLIHTLLYVMTIHTYIHILTSLEGVNLCYLLKSSETVVVSASKVLSWILRLTSWLV